MKKTKILSLLLAIAMVVSILPASVFAASTTKVTAADGTVRTDNVPFCQKYSYSICQYVILESELEDMVNKTITDLTWYYSDSGYCTRYLEVYLSISYFEDFSCFLAPYGEIKVFEGDVNLEPGGSDTNPNELTLEFQNEFEYTEGSIVVTVVDRTGDYRNGCSFYGVQTAKNTSVIKYSDYIEYNIDDIMSYAGELCPFTPKTTFGVASSFKVNIDESITNGTVTAPATAYEGSTVTLEIIPTEGYTLDKLTVMQGETEVPLTGENQFVMPSGDVTVTATFSDKEKITIELTDTYGDGWNGNKIIAYLWDGETKTLLNDEITIEDGSSATFKLSVDKNAEVCFCWGAGEFAEECLFEITRGDYTYTATRQMCDSFTDGDVFYLSTPDGSGDLTIFYPAWSIIGLDDTNVDPGAEGIRMSRRFDGKYTLSKDLEAGEHEFRLYSGETEKEYGAASEEQLLNGSMAGVLLESEADLHFTLTEKGNVTFIFNPVDGEIMLSWGDNSKPGLTTIGVGENEATDIPFEPYYCYSVCQYLIPADMLSALDGKAITDVTYYYNTKSDNVFPQVVKVYLQEVEINSLESFVDTSDATEVFDGTVNLDNKSGKHELTLDFDNSFYYNGGDLLVTIVKDADEYFEGTVFYGSSGLGSVVYGVSDDEAYDVSNITEYDYNTSDFMPMTTFGYEDVVYEIIYFEDGEATVDIPKPGQYSVVFASYDGGRLDSVDIVPVTVTKETAGRISGIETDILLDRGDKIMLLSDTESITPLCEEYLTYLIIL